MFSTRLSLFKEIVFAIMVLETYGAHITVLQP